MKERSPKLKLKCQGKKEMINSNSDKLSKNKNPKSLSPKLNEKNIFMGRKVSKK